jgi:hypothetical protein
LIGNPRQTASDATGEYRVADLAPGIYQVQAIVSGFKTAVHTGIHLAADTTLVVDIELELASISESVRVSAKSPVVDVKSPEAPYRLTADLISNLPTNRVLSDVMNLMPGVNAGIGLGGVQSSNPLYVDGVNVADAWRLAPWASFNYNWVEDVQVVGVGAGAEYGEFSGIIQKSRLKSGANRFSGLAEYRTTRPRWVGTNTSSLSPSLQSNFAARSERILDWRDTSAQLGGPLRRDRLWFFSGVQASTSNIQPALYAGPESIDTNNRRVLGKIDSALRGSLRAGGFYEYDRSHVIGDGLGPFTPIETTWTDTQPDRNWNARTSWILGGRTTFEIEQTGSGGTLSFDPTAPATRAAPYPHYDDATGLPSGNVDRFLDYGSSRRAIGATMSHYATGGMGGNHDLQIGVQHERNRVDSAAGYPGGRSYVDLDGAPYLVYLWDGDQQTTWARRTTVYVQDEWAVADRLTLQPGLRATFNRGAASQGIVLSTTPISPRVGMAWDVSHDHKTVVRGHYGRYHDASLTAQFNFVDERPPSPVITAQVVAPDRFVEIDRDGIGPRFTLDPDIAQGHFDQWVAGLERQLWQSTSLTVQYIGRHYGNQMGYLDLGSIYEPVVRRDPGADNRVGTADDGELMTVFKNTSNVGDALYYFTNPSGVSRRYSAVQLIGRKQYGGSWQMQASYSWSSTRGNAVNGANSNAGGPDLGNNGVTADPNRAINADGPMPWDFTHEVKLLGTWRVPLWGGFNVSSVYQFHTGNAWGRTAQFLPSVQFVTFGVRIEPRGTRRTPALSTVDFRIEKTFNRTRPGKIGVFADVFNLNNQGIPDPTARRPVVELSGSSFGLPQFWLSPRTLRAGVRMSF